MKKLLIVVLILMGFTTLVSAQSYWYVERNTTTVQGTAYLTGSLRVSNSTTTYQVLVSSTAEVLLNNGTYWFDSGRTWGMTVNNGIISTTVDSGSTWLNPGTTVFSKIKLNIITGTPDFQTAVTHDGSVTIETGNSLFVKGGFETGTIVYNLGGHFEIQATSNTLRFEMDSDITDYIYMETDSDVPLLLWGGQTKIAGFRNNDATDKLQFTHDKAGGVWADVGSGVSVLASSVAVGAITPTIMSGVLVSSFPFTGVTAGTYTNMKATVNAQGMITLASSGAGGGGTAYDPARFTVPGTIGVGDDQTAWWSPVSTCTITGVWGVLKTSGTSSLTSVDVWVSADYGITKNSIFTTTYNVVRMDIFERSSRTATEQPIINGTYDNIQPHHILGVDVDKTGDGKNLTIFLRCEID